jgi:hypothetical protein
MQSTDILRLEEKIQKLQQKKETLSQQEDKTLLKKLHSLCGTNFSPQLIMGIVSAALETATPSQKEDWMKIGATFWKRASKPQKEKA